MNARSRKPTFTTTTTASILVFLFLVSYTHFFYSSSSCSSALWTALLALAGLSLAAVCLAVIARTTMVAWITVLVLLTFKGKRHVLAHQGKKITADVAMDLIKVLVMERRFVTVICATAVSLMAMAQVTRF